MQRTAHFATAGSMEASCGGTKPGGAGLQDQERPVEQEGAGL